MDNGALHVINHPNLPQRLLKAREALLLHFRPILNHFGVTEQQWRILRALDQDGALEPRQIGELCQISSPSMAGVLARMADAGLVERARIEADQRRVLVSLSQQGRALLVKMSPLIDLQYEYIEQACGKQMFADLLAALDTFIERKQLPVRQVELG
jgi:homoprotocatechuate degradation regulator HpaR